MAQCFVHGLLSWNWLSTHCMREQSSVPVWRYYHVVTGLMITNTGAAAASHSSISSWSAACCWSPLGSEPLKRCVQIQHEDKSGAKTKRQQPPCVRFVIPASRLIVVLWSVVTLSGFTQIVVCVLVRCSAPAQEDRNDPTWHCEGSVARLFSFLF